MNTYDIITRTFEIPWLCWRTSAALIAVVSLSWIYLCFSRIGYGTSRSVKLQSVAAIFIINFTLIKHNYFYFRRISLNQFMELLFSVRRQFEKENPSSADQSRFVFDRVRNSTELLKKSEQPIHAPREKKIRTLSNPCREWLVDWSVKYRYQKISISLHEKKIVRKLMYAFFQTLYI